MSPELCDSILQYYKYRSLQLKDIDEGLILDELSPGLRSEVLNHLCLEKMKRLPCMDGLSDGFIKSAVNAMYPYMVR